MATVYDFKLKDKKGNEVSLDAYKGKVLLIVNTATGCGFTPQYEELEAMYHELKDKGFEILDVPCDQSVIRLLVLMKKSMSSVRQSLVLTSHNSRKVR